MVAELAGVGEAEVHRKTKVLKVEGNRVHFRTKHRKNSLTEVKEKNFDHRRRENEKNSASAGFTHFNNI